MKAVSLFTGGKDSSYSLYKAIKEGYEIKGLLTMDPDKDNSYLYHSKNLGLTSLMAESMGMKEYKFSSSAKKEEETNELKSALKELKNRIEYEAVVAGAIRSNYQRKRIEKIAKQLNLDLYLPLWNIDIEEYLTNLVENEFEAIITSVSAAGLDESYLGKKIDSNLIDELKQIKDKYDINLAGEGGEYETTTLNAPLFNKKIKIQDSEKKYDKKTLRGELKIKEAVLD